MFEIKAQEDGTFTVVPTIPVEGYKHPTDPRLESTGVLLLREADLRSARFPTREAAVEAVRSLGVVTEELSDAPTTSLPELVAIAADPEFDQKYYQHVPPERRRLFDLYLRQAISIYKYSVPETEHTAE